MVELVYILCKKCGQQLATASNSFNNLDEYFVQPILDETWTIDLEHLGTTGNPDLAQSHKHLHQSSKVSHALSCKGCRVQVGFRIGEESVTQVRSYCRMYADKSTVHFTSASKRDGVIMRSKSFVPRLQWSLE